MAQPLESDVLDALGEIIDPELGLDFVSLGLIYNVAIEGGKVHVEYSLTTPGCPIAGQVEGYIEQFVSEIEGVTEVTSQLVWLPMWSPSMMSEDAKFAFGY